MNSRFVDRLLKSVMSLLLIVRFCVVGPALRTSAVLRRAKGGGGTVLEKSPFAFKKAFVWVTSGYAGNL